MARVDWENGKGGLGEWQGWIGRMDSTSRVQWELGMSDRKGQRREKEVGH